MTRPTFLQRRKALGVIALTVAGALVSGATGAQTPDTSSRPIKIVVPFAPGGSNDMVGRSIAQQLTIRLKRTVVVENRPGAGGAIGAESVARAEPDGTTFLLISSSFTMNSSIMKLSYDPVKSFTPVAFLGIGPSVVVVNAAMPVNTMGELVAYSKKHPGTVNFASAGVASFTHFGAELLRTRTHADMAIIQYKGGGPAMSDLTAGHVQMSLISMLQMVPHLKGGRIKVIGVAGPKRSELIPGVPTLKEQGYDVDASNWWGLLAPAGTPAGPVDAIHREVNLLLSEPQMKRRFTTEGAEATPMTRVEFEKFMGNEFAKWAQVAKQTGIQPE